jgi:hypothetical protein
MYIIHSINTYPMIHLGEPISHRLRATGPRRWCHQPSAVLHGRRSALHGSGPERRAQHGAAGYGLGPQMLDESTCAYVVVWVGGFGDLGN